MNIIQNGKAICYSGYRRGQSPVTGVCPSYEEVKEDLLILEQDFDYIRMYDPNEHTQMAVEVIRKENLQLKVMVGMNLLGEISNPNCAWGGEYSQEQLVKHITHNQEQLEMLVSLANEYEDVIFSVSAGNEAVPEWNENLVSPQRVLYFVTELKKRTNQLVTYCDNNYYWQSQLYAVAQAVDFISIHTYPVWLGAQVDQAIHESVNDYYHIQNLYKGKQVVITEAGWPTTSSGNQILPHNANKNNQEKYIEKMQQWSEDSGVLIFFFEAFDEPWKGSNNPNEPEKHWGIYTVDRELK